MSRRFARKTRCMCNSSQVQKRSWSVAPSPWTTGMKTYKLQLWSIEKYDQIRLQHTLIVYRKNPQPRNSMDDTAKGGPTQF